MQRNFIFNGGNSTRYHTFDVHTRQDIGNHSFGVAWFCELISCGAASKELIMAALTHDLAEHVVGDIPAPAKRALNLREAYDGYEQKELDGAGVGDYMRSLTKRELTILKLADCMEGLQFCLRERKFGNRNIDVAFNNYTSYVDKILREQGTYISNAARIFNEIQQEWKELTNERSKQDASGGATLSGDVPALGLGQSLKAAVSSGASIEIPYTVEKEKRPTRFTKGGALPSEEYGGGEGS